LCLEMRSFAVLLALVATVLVVSLRISFWSPSPSTKAQESTMSTTPTPNPEEISQIPLPDILARLRDEGYPPPETGFSSWEDWFHATLTRGPFTLAQLVAKLEANSPVPPSFFGHATWEEEIAANLQKIQDAQQQAAGSGAATPPAGATPPHTYPQDWYWEPSGGQSVGGIAELPNPEEPSEP
jgi:hypothetical protein